jgi:protein-disulfide isomerase
MQFKQRMLGILGGAASLLFVACTPESKTSASLLPKGPAAAKAEENMVVATIGERAIYLQEIDKQAAAELHEIEEQRYQIRRQALEQLINQEALQKELNQLKISEAEYLKKEIEEKVPEPSTQDAEDFFKKNAAQLPKDAKFEEYKERIVAFIKRQNNQEQAKAVFSKLRSKAEVKVTLAPPPKPRIEVEAKGPSTGPENAKITLVEFSDFECPFCARAKETVDKVMKKYDGKVKLVFRHFPLSFHPHAKKAAEASVCAHAQNKFWPFYDALYADQGKLEDKELRGTAEKVGLNLSQYDTCMQKNEGSAIVDEDMRAAEKAGVKGTPAFFINGIVLSGAQPFEQFEQVIEQELSAK